MDCFSVDSCRSLLDIGSPEDLKDLWESDLDPVSFKSVFLIKTNMNIFNNSEYVFPFRVFLRCFLKFWL